VDLIRARVVTEQTIVEGVPVVDDMSADASAAGQRRCKIVVASLVATAIVVALIVVAVVLVWARQPQRDESIPVPSQGGVPSNPTPSPTLDVRVNGIVSNYIYDNEKYSTNISTRKIVGSVRCV